MTQTHERIRTVFDALSAAYPDIVGLNMVLYLSSGRDLNDIAAANLTRKVRIFELCQTAEAQGWTPHLVKAVLDDPNQKQNAALHAALTPFLQREAPPKSASISEVIGQFRGYVGLIEADGRPVATCVLVGPDLVLTPNHVVAPFAPGTPISIRFDHFRDADDKVHPGWSMPLAPDWLFRGTGTGQDLGRSGYLDYALLRLSQRVDARPRPTGVQGSAARGWCALTPDIATPEPNGFLTLIQHADGGPQQVIPARLTDDSADWQILSYSASTRPGASGAPVFSGNGDLLGINAGALLNDDAGPKVCYGVPAVLIANDLAAHGLLPEPPR